MNRELSCLIRSQNLPRSPGLFLVPVPARRRDAAAGAVLWRPAEVLLGRS
jgi:hypothetical protein